MKKGQYHQSQPNQKNLQLYLIKDMEEEEVVVVVRKLSLQNRGPESKKHFKNGTNLVLLFLNMGLKIESFCLT
jgi:hypothetical protein